MTARTNTAPLQSGRDDVSRLMRLVLFALIPGMLVTTWYFGYGLLINLVIAVPLAIALEALALRLRGLPAAPALKDNSALLTAVLFAIAIPPGAPWWLVILGIGFAILIAKHAFGGLGQNPFNPTMSAYLLLLLAYPLLMTTWQVPADILDATTARSPLDWSGFLQSLQASLGMPGASVQADGLAMATPLIEYKLGAPATLLQAQDAGQSLFARGAGTAWELTSLAYLAGGLLLLGMRVITWHIPLSILATILLLSAIFYGPNQASVYGTPYLHLLSGATLFGAFFIATDPVTAATTRRGQLLYGILIGVSIYAIRVWGSYLDGVAIAVLFGNFCAPLLDRLCRPRIYGHRGSRPPAPSLPEAP